jgi:hypothetical protein
MARVTAERLVAYLARCGFVLMKRQPAPTPSVPERRIEQRREP